MTVQITPKLTQSIHFAPEIRGGLLTTFLYADGALIDKEDGADTLLP